MDITVLALHIHKASRSMRYARYSTETGSSQLFTGIVTSLVDRQNVTAQRHCISSCYWRRRLPNAHFTQTFSLHMNQNSELANITETIPTEKKTTRFINTYMASGVWSEWLPGGRPVDRIPVGISVPVQTSPEAQWIPGTVPGGSAISTDGRG
jgi:hypothetical protein